MSGRLLFLLSFAGGLLSLAVSSFAARPPEEVDLLIRGGVVVTMAADGKIIEDGAVALRGERIVAVGPDAEVAAKVQAKRTLNAAGRAVMPGLINAHTHAPMVLFRGLADDLPLMEWLRKNIFPAEAKNVSEEFCRAGTRLACLEMMQGGTTTFVDMYYFESAIADETAKAGMRGVLGQAVIDFPVPDAKNWADGLTVAAEHVRRWKDHPLITPALAPHAPYTVSAEHLKEARDFAKKFDVPLLIHVAENQDEIATIRAKHGSTPVGYLESLDFFSQHVLAAHTVWLTDEDIQILVRRKVGTAHCPQSNMKLASGAAPVPQMLKAGVAVGLGTDGAASNNLLDMWREIDFAAKLHKLTTKDAAAVPARAALEMATIGGARALRREKKLGSLEAGKLADVIIVRLDGAHQTPLHNVLSQLVYATRASDVETTIVHGKIIMEERKSKTLDEAKTLAEARQWRERIKKSLEKP